MLEDLNKKIDALISDIENVQKQYKDSFKRMEEEYASINRRAKELNATIDAMADDILEKSKIADRNIAHVKDVSKNIDESLERSATSINEFTKKYDDLKKYADRIKSDAQNIDKKISDTNSELTKISDQIKLIKKAQYDIKTEQLTIENKGTDIINNLKKAESDYHDKTNSIALEFTKNLNKVNGLSLEVEKVKNHEITNYFTSTDEAKKKWEQAIIEIINDNMEVTEIKEGLFKKKYIITKKQGN